MGLSTLAEILRWAESRETATGAFNVLTLGQARAAVDAAEALQMPVILAVAEGHLPYVDFEPLAAGLVRLARAAAVPVAVHLDHATREQTVVRALRQQFTSVMFDGSMLPLEENIARTAAMVALAHPVGVSVEGEVGHVGGEHSESGPRNGVDPGLLTAVADATRFAGETGVDAMAVAVGNAHGHYHGLPRLDLNRLAAIDAAVRTPLVLHGGSGLPDAQLEDAARRGVRKFNFFTDLSDAALESARALLAGQGRGHRFIGDLIQAADRAFGEAASRKLGLFGRLRADVPVPDQQGGR